MRTLLFFFSFIEDGQKRWFKMKIRKDALNKKEGMPVKKLNGAIQMKSISNFRKGHFKKINMGQKEERSAEQEKESKT